MCAHPLMKLCDEPQLRLQVGSMLLCGDVTQEVFVSHPRCHEYVPLVLPRLLILHKPKGCVFRSWWFVQALLKMMGSLFMLHQAEKTQFVPLMWPHSGHSAKYPIFQNLYILIFKTSRSSFNIFHCYEGITRVLSLLQPSEWKNKTSTAWLKRFLTLFPSCSPFCDKKNPWITS